MAENQSGLFEAGRLNNTPILPGTNDGALLVTQRLSGKDSSESR